jgi:hypothetical protein
LQNFDGHPQIPIGASEPEYAFPNGRTTHPSVMNCLSSPQAPGVSLPPGTWPRIKANAGSGVTPL